MLITAGRLHASCAAIWLLPFRVSSHDVWDPAPASEGENPGMRRWRLCPWRLGVRVRRSAFKKGSIPQAVAMPSHLWHSSRPSTFWAPRWGAPALPSFCYCLRSATPWGLALFSHCSASRIFIMQPGCSPSPMVTRRDDHQPCGGEKQAELQPLPRPQLQGCSSSGLGRRRAELGPASAWAGGPLLPPTFGGEGHPPALRRRRPPAMQGKANCCCLVRVQLSVLHPGDGRAMRRRLLSPVLKWWPPLGRLPTAIVVASADETVNATCAPDLQLFGFNGWLSSPVRGREQGPFGNSVCPKAIATAV
jgi:hypothetical protein